MLGATYIADTLAFAHATDPGARLFINENFALEPGPKQDRLARLVEELQAVGAPLHGIGFQGHVNFLPGVNRPTRAQIEAALPRREGPRPSAMPLVFDDDYRRKPAYFGVRAGLLTAP